MSSQNICFCGHHMNTHKIGFHREIKQISVFSGWKKKALYLELHVLTDTNIVPRVKVNVLRFRTPKCLTK